jgi:hypothetical protein
MMDSNSAKNTGGGKNFTAFMEKEFCRIDSMPTQPFEY